MKKMTILSFAALLTLGTATLSSAYSTYFGQDPGAGEGTRLTEHLNADAARTSFLNNLSGVGTETFESFNNGTAGPLALNFTGAGTATISGTGTVSTVSSGTNGVGRYPISGVNYWETGSNFSISFSEAVAAFGFYGIDVGDYNGQVTLELIGGATKTINVGNSTNVRGGGVLYFGVIDTENPFTKITFGNTAGGTDYFGFDDMTIGSIEQVQNPVPEPSTLLLLGGGLLGLGFARKRFAKK